MTYLKSLSVENFKGFFKKETVYFAKPNGNSGSGLTILVGQNNSGKSTVLEVFQRIHLSNAFERSERHSEKNVILTLRNTDKKDNIKVLETKGGSQSYTENLNIYPTADDIYPLMSRRFWNPYFQEDTYTRDQHRIQSLYQLNKSILDDNVGKRLIAIERNPVQKKEFDGFMKELILNFNDWYIDSDKGLTFLNYRTKSGEHHSNLFGDGLIGLFKIALSLFDLKEGEIIIIDEPELSLHPQAQKRLAQILSRKACKNQIVIITHSPYFVNWSDIKNGATVNKFSKKRDMRCMVRRLRNKSYHFDKITSLIDDYTKSYMMDIVAKEIFFSENIVFVEGQEDTALIKKYIEDNNININFDIFGYGAGGANSINHFIKLCSELLINCGAIYDRDKLKEAQKTMKDFSVAHIEILSTDDIRDKTGKVGLFNKKGVVKPSSVKELNHIIDSFNSFFGSRS